MATRISSFDVEPAVIEAAVEVVASRGRADAISDLLRCHGRIQAEARTRAERLVRTARPGAHSAHSRYDAAARVLREWYLVVHDAAAASSLGRVEDVPGPEALESTAALVGRIRTGQDPRGPLKATALVWRVALADADAAVLAAILSLRSGVADHARVQVGLLLGAGVPAQDVRCAILRHWYQRCYLEAVDAELGLLAPLKAVTRAEAHEVAASISAGQARRLIGTDGVPLLTAHGTRMTDADRRLAAGGTGVVSAAPRPTRRVCPDRSLREHVVRGWVGSSTAGRLAWACAAGVPEAADHRRWADVPADVQSPLIARWLEDHRDRFAPPASDDEPAQYPAFVAARHRLRGPAEEAAALMFAHAPHVPR